MTPKASNRVPAPEVITDLTGDAVVEIFAVLRQLLADVFTLYVKTKNFHWHMSGRHFRDYHLLLDEQAEQGHAQGGKGERSRAQLLSPHE